MTNYRRGVSKEYAVLKYLRAKGYEATRSAGSHGLWDVSAIANHKPVKLIQVKYTKVAADWRDENWLRLCSIVSDVPVDIEAWVFRFGVRDPHVWVPTCDGDEKFGIVNMGKPE